MAKRSRKNLERDEDGRAAKDDGLGIIGERVRELYEAKGWTQQELAWKANLSLPKVNRVIRGKAGIGSAALIRLVVVLNTSADYLLGLTDDKRSRPM